MTPDQIKEARELCESAKDNRWAGGVWTRILPAALDEIERLRREQGRYFLQIAEAVGCPYADDTHTLIIARRLKAEVERLQARLAVAEDVVTAARHEGDCRDAREACEAEFEDQPGCCGEWVQAHETAQANLDRVLARYQEQQT